MFRTAALPFAFHGKSSVMARATLRTGVPMRNCDPYRVTRLILNTVCGAAS